ncbi:hypothetical protein FJ656_29930, partial [Schumannella luteola]
MLLYLWFWALVPREAGTPDAPRTRRVPVAAVLLGIAGGLALLLPFTWRLDQPVPLGLVESAAAAVLAIVWATTADARDPQRAASAPVVRSLAAGFLALLGLAVLLGAFVGSRTLVAIVAVT